jgi:hypothetical protein
VTEEPERGCKGKKALSERKRTKRMEERTHLQEKKRRENGRNNEEMEL